MMGYGFSPFGFIFVLLYAVVVIYVLMQIGGINKSLQRIAAALESKQSISGGGDSNAGGS
ncbi:hypothetical protein AXX12_02345 [Anaerosporomusa subterranea]|uniref:Uncharacterized protein n=1 Tax=Anaerosporomusa subterranea TaxID=1794912 RepID=A0A154BSM7_ANASB|nr:hypothetical protein [Anaerosporomusa subterranea]KYZ77003.1 hypothetical protein AXX12_02345 [Anaerosporomusa subterranea]